MTSLSCLHLPSLCCIGSTVSFASSGAIMAGHTGIDSLGYTIVGGIPAVGGGTVRDLIIGQLPVIWIAEVDYLWLLLATTAKSKSSLLQSSSSGLRTLAQRGLHSSPAELNSLLIPAYLCMTARSGLTNDFFQLRVVNKWIIHHKNYIVYLCVVLPINKHITFTNYHQLTILNTQKTRVEELLFTQCPLIKRQIVTKLTKHVLISPLLLLLV